MSFWKPGTVAPGSNILRDSVDDDSSFVPIDSRPSIAQRRYQLPINRHRTELLYLIEKYKVLIVVSPTGSGKTTQLPRYLFEAGWTTPSTNIACVQPRRVSLMSVAGRVAEEMKCDLGDTVGYADKFESHFKRENTKILFMSEDFLLKELASDPRLSSYDVIILEDVQERTAFTDLLFALLYELRQHRHDLRVIITSTSLDTKPFQEYFGNDISVSVSVGDTVYPIFFHYLKEACSNYVEASVATVIGICQNDPLGDILVFLTGYEEVEACASSILTECDKLRIDHRVMVLPLYAGLALENQRRIFDEAPRGVHKIIVSTNVAESSVNITSIVYVVDCGFVKSRYYDPIRSIEVLRNVPVSKCSSLQRAERAGHMSAGHCYRLYPECDFHLLPEHTTQEIQRARLEGVLLQALRISKNIADIRWMTCPEPKITARALETLFGLRAIDDHGILTTLGRQLADLPVPPLLGCILVNSFDMGCSEELLSIVSLLATEKNAFYEKDKSIELFGVKEGDLLTYLNVMRGFSKQNNPSRWCHLHGLNFQTLRQANEICQYLVEYFRSKNISRSSCDDRVDLVQKAIFSGMFMQTAKIQADGSYRSLRDDTILHIHPHSVLFNQRPEYVVYERVLETNKAYMRNVSVVNSSWVADIVPDFFDIVRVKKY